jgi:hypothetical protein
MENKLTTQMRETLQPKGTAPLVRLFLNNAAYFNKDFVKSCIDEIERKTFLVACELDDFTPLEKLGFHVLCDSAYINKHSVEE